MAVTEKTFPFQGVDVAYWEGGEGPAILLLHGSGPGASTMGIFKGLLESLSLQHHVCAMDLIGFGRSGRKSALPYFDMPLWLAQCQAMLELFGRDRVCVLGHSLSGVLALKLAGHSPQISSVITTGSPGAPFDLPPQLERAWNYPTTRDELRVVAEDLIYDHRLVTEENLDIRMQVLSDPAYRAYFEGMFKGSKPQVLAQLVISAEELAAVKCPVVLVHGRNDPMVPMSVAIELGERIDRADVHILDRCAHSVAVERPAFIRAIIEIELARQA